MHSADFFRTTSPRGILEDYLTVNADVAERSTLLQLAPFALRRKIKKIGVETLFTNNPLTSHRHRCWFIWNTLRLAGLDRHWYADELNRGDLMWKGWVRRIQRNSTPEEREKWANLLYVRSFPDPSGSGKRGLKRLWTKGGGWPRTLGMSRILVMREHIYRPDCWYTHAIGESNLRLMEDELGVVCNPDKGIMPTQYHRAVEYVRARSKDFSGKRMTYKWIVWFFQMDIVIDGEVWWLRNGQMRRNSHKSIEW